MGAFQRLDPTTLQLAIAVFSALLAALSFGLARTLPEHGAVLRHWARSMSCGALAFACYFLRGHAPEWLTLLMANLAALGTPIFGLLAHARFLRRRVPLAFVLAIAAIGWAGPLATAILGTPMVSAVFSMSLACAALSLITAALIARQRTAVRSAGMWLSFAAFAGFGGMLAVRSLLVLIGTDALPMDSNAPPQLTALFIGCLFVICGTLGVVMMVQEHQQQHALERARRDGLTGLLVRDAFVQAACRHLQQGHAAALLMIDIDHFKQVNDRHGHAGGDQVLIHATRLLGSRCRSTDLVGRYGGEEFCLLLLDGGVHTAGGFAERLVRDARAAPVRLGSAECRYTISVGFALHAGGACSEAQAAAALPRLFDRAAQAL